MESILPKRYILAQPTKFILIFLHNMFEVHNDIDSNVEKLPHGNWVKVVVKVVQLYSQLAMGSISILVSNYQLQFSIVKFFIAIGGLTMAPQTTNIISSW